ncbi:MAG TPA: 16S rRNA (adenine(1518)-N(6)/adenine(1519)-N(6))-dimethyltransferase RsmA [Acidobacteriota bacterium]|nr:16S rRNA (adenine(1518)-N(6)/adenine(1519)-N(6))-dimethyltransferase RsmA [Acidobacteriota bacterium]
MLRPAPSFGSRRGEGGTSGHRATSGVVATLRALDVRPSRRLGQNFLTDPRVAERIAAVALEAPGDGPILEIGPGLGALTEPLAASGRPVLAVELDLRLAEHLESLLAPWPNARVARGDILDQSLGALILGAAPVTIVANLPYAITSPAIAWIVEQGPRVARALLMTQREVAQRLAAKPGTKEYGSFSVFVALHAELEVRFRVSPGAFHPRPDVDSVVFTLTPRPYPGTTAEERAEVMHLVRAATGGRRKTLANALGQGLEIGADAARALLERAAIDPGRRAETLSVEDWLAVARVEGARP